MTQINDENTTASLKDDDMLTIFPGSDKQPTEMAGSEGNQDSGQHVQNNISRDQAPVR